MRTNRIVSGFASWRWMPCCALIAGSLLYVALVVLVVPNSLGTLPRTLSAPANPHSDMLTSGALGGSATHPSHRSLAAHPTGTPNALGHALGAAVAPPPSHLAESRAAALGSPVMTPRPALPPPPPAPAPPEPAPEPAAAQDAPAPDQPAPVVQPHPAIRSLVNGMHVIAPHVAPGVVNRDQPADDNNSGGSGNDDGQQ